MKATKLVQVFLVGTILALVVAGLFTSAIIRERQQGLDKVLGYNFAFDANQAVIECLRLEKALYNFADKRTPANLEAVRLRFEIMFNRVQLFGQGEFKTYIQGAESRRQVFKAFSSAAENLDPILTPAGLDLTVEDALQVLAPLERELLGFASEANRFMAGRAAGDHEALVRLHWRFSGLMFGLIISGLLLVGMLSWNNRLLMRAHGELKLTTDDLQRTAIDLASANQAVAAANSELRAQNTLLVEKEDALRAQNGLFNAALNNMSQGLCMFDDNMRPIVMNTQFEELFHVAKTAEADRSAGEARLLTLREIAPDLAREIEENIQVSRAASFETECCDGRIIAVAQQPMPAGGWVATFEDVTEQRRAQSRIAHMARHDGLTNLPNRYAFRERILEGLQESQVQANLMAIMCLDLDHFKEVNDALGHPTGDALLCAAAERLVGCIRETDMVARIGGDEFAILQLSIEHAEEAESLAGRIIEEMHKPFNINGETVYATASLGIALSPTHGTDPDVLLKNADLALYAAKGAGRRTHRFFEEEMDERLISRHAMERDLRQAIALRQFKLHYQPVVQLSTMRITGFEALLRWTHPVRGAVPPSSFIPVAEDAGLITEIGRWVLREACATAAGWPDDLKVSVNLSAAQFVNGDIAEDVNSALGSAKLRANRLVVEITESLLLSDKQRTLDTLHRLKSLGIDIAMDDFGTGYSSLSYLRKYPFDKIKIDRAFVNTAERGEPSAAIIRTIVQLGSSLGMTTVAEGVETEEHLQMLLAAGCPEGQGYLFSPPVPSEEVFGLLTADQRWASKVA